MTQSKEAILCQSSCNDTGSLYRLYIVVAFLFTHIENATYYVVKIMFGVCKMNLLKRIKNVISAKKNNSDEQQLLMKIEEGFEKNEFKLHVQFIVDNKTKKIVLAEALSRWENSEGEIIFPGAYIGLIEKSGLIVKFDYYMLEKVCQKLSHWKNSELQDISISCNITRITISEKGFASKVKEITDKYDFDRSKLIIEITEDSIEKNLDVAKQNIIETKKLGICIALDDIGRGYTSLISLCEYPIDIVKVDRDVLLHTDNESGKKLFLGIVSLVHSLNLKVVCEGVETDEQNDFVSKSECDYIQGWYYSKGLPESKAEDFYREYMNKF